MGQVEDAFLAWLDEEIRERGFDLMCGIVNEKKVKAEWRVLIEARRMYCIINGLEVR